MKGRSLSGYQRKRVWLNDGLGRFTDVAQVVGATDTYDGRAVALADLGNRGVLDVIVANQSGPLLIYRNTVAARPALDQFELEGTVDEQPQRHRRARRAALERSQQVQQVSGGERLQRAEPAAPALRARCRRRGRSRRDPLAVGPTSRPSNSRPSTCCIT